METVIFKNSNAGRFKAAIGEDLVGKRVWIVMFQDLLVRTQA